jgi:hypothetical protein
LCKPQFSHEGGAEQLTKGSPDSSNGSYTITTRSCCQCLAWLVSLADLVAALLVRTQWSTLKASAVVAIVIAAALTVRVNFPINDQVITWSAAAPPDDIREFWSPWEKAHTIRTILWLGPFALEVAAWCEP